VLLGGMLTKWAGWEWVLFVNVPIGVAAAAIAPRILPESRHEGRRVFDITGAVLVTAGLALLVFAIVDAPKYGWGSLHTLGIGAIALALLAAFIGVESRTSHPLMPFSIFRLRTLRGANVIGLLIGMSLFSMFFFISLYLQQVLGYDALKTGLSYLPLAFAIIFAAGIASQLVSRLGYKPPLTAGLLMIAGALFWFSTVSAGGSYVSDVLFPSIIVGVGLGFSFVPVTIAAVAGTRPDEAGLASGLINTSQQVGGALGLAILAALANSRTADVLAGGEHSRAVALTEGFQRAFLVGSAFALVAAILTVLLISSADSREHAEAAQRGEVEAVAA
jgi:EmrB/QacA subfamily drug resistance transporter